MWKYIARCRQKFFFGYSRERSEWKILPKFHELRGSPQNLKKRGGERKTHVRGENAIESTDYEKNDQIVG